MGRKPGFANAVLVKIAFVTSFISFSISDTNTNSKVPDNNASAQMVQPGSPLLVGQARSSGLLKEPDVLYKLYDEHGIRFYIRRIHFF
jgi:hypothetical protein